VECLSRIVRRRNRIAHEADRDPEDGTARLPVLSTDADWTIDRIELIADAIAAVLGPPPAMRSAPLVVAAASPRDQLYLRFWAEFKPVVERRGWTKARPQAQNWWDMPAGVTGTMWVVSFSQFGCRSELYFQHPDPMINLARWRVLAERRDEIVARFGEGLIFDDLPRRKACRIETRMFDVTIEERDKWPAIRQWMEDSQVRLRAAIAAVGGVPTAT
jgi:hypothetical protein